MSELDLRCNRVADQISEPEPVPDLGHDRRRCQQVVQALDRDKELGLDKGLESILALGLVRDLPVDQELVRDPRGCRDSVTRVPALGCRIRERIGRRHSNPDKET